jgi:acyl carrier protein
VLKVLGHASSAPVDANQGFFEIGMDSLMAVDLQRRLNNGLGITLPSTVGFDYPTVEALAKYLAGKALSFQAPVALPAYAPKAPANSGTDGSSLLDQMSEDELLTLFAEELDLNDKEKPGLENQQ